MKKQMNDFQTGLVSVIVPVYNASKTLDRVVESIVMQTYRHIELILVNDGSKDNSRQVCETWALKDKRIKVINIENMGQGYARNTGMDSACGEYIGFVDADDYLESDMYEILVKVIEENHADLAACGHCDVVDGKLIERRSDDCGTLDRRTALVEFSKDKHIKWSLCDKIFRHDSIGDLRITTERIHAEDALFLLNFIKQNKKFSYVDTGSYHYYRSNPDSFTKRKWSKANIGLADFYRSLFETAKEYGLTEVTDSCQARHYENLLSTYLRCCRNGYTDEADKFLNEMREKKSDIIKASRFRTIMKIDLLITITFPRIGQKMNFWYK